MRTLRGRSRVALIAAAAVALVSTAVVSAPTARATPLTTVSIQATVTQGFSGVWQASGAINDSGSWVRTDVNLTGSFFNSPVVGAFQAEFAFSGLQGTFRVRDEVLGTAAGVTGHWQIVSGTGAYARMSGYGISNFDFSTSTIFFSGLISKTA